MAKLIAKQQRFVEEYLVDLNATQAYLRAGYKVSESVAAVNAQRLLRNAKIQDVLSLAMKKRAERTEITQDKVVQELAKIAFSKGTDFVRIAQRTGYRPVFDDKGNVIDQEPYEIQVVEILNTDEVPADKQAAIAGIKQGANGIEVKLNDKVKALELLGRHLGMFNDKLEVTGNMNNPFAGLTTEELKKLIQDG